MAHTLPPVYCDSGECQRSHALMPENHTAWRIFTDCLSQIILGPGGELVGMKHSAIWRQIDELGVEPDRMVLFRKVRTAEAEWVNIETDKRKKAEEKRKRERKLEELRRKGSR